MEILQFLLSFLLGEQGKQKLEPIFNLFKEKSFDLNKILHNLNPEVIAPLLKDLFSAFENKTPPTDFSVRGDYKLEPIARIADKDTVYTLNLYFT